MITRKARTRRLLLGLAGISLAGTAAAQSPFAFLFGGSPREGRSAYAPVPAYGAAPSYVPPPSYGYRPGPYDYSSLPGYGDPYYYEPRFERRSRPRPVERRVRVRPAESSASNQRE